jgi:hypothetical protein
MQRELAETKAALVVANVALEQVQQTTQQVHLAMRVFISACAIRIPEFLYAPMLIAAGWDGGPANLVALRVLLAAGADANGEHGELHWTPMLVAA